MQDVIFTDPMTIPDEFDPNSEFAESYRQFDRMDTQEIDKGTLIRSGTILLDILGVWKRLTDHKLTRHLFKSFEIITTVGHYVIMPGNDFILDLNKKVWRGVCHTSPTQWNHISKGIKDKISNAMSEIIDIESREALKFKQDSCEEIKQLNDEIICEIEKNSQAMIEKMGEISVLKSEEDALSNRVRHINNCMSAKVAELKARAKAAKLSSRKVGASSVDKLSAILLEKRDEIEKLESECKALREEIRKAKNDPGMAIVNKINTQVGIVSVNAMVMKNKSPEAIRKNQITEQIGILEKELTKLKNNDKIMRSRLRIESAQKKRELNSTKVNKIMAFKELIKTTKIKVKEVAESCV